MTLDEKAAAFDLLVAAVTNRWHDGTWSINCTSLVAQPCHPTAEACLPDLLAWADRVAKFKAKQRAAAVPPL